MTELIACLSTGKGTWAQVYKLVDNEQFEKIVLITNDFGKENFKKNDKTELVAVDMNKDVKLLRDDILAKLKELIKGSEVAVNFISGAGKEHMAMMGALVKMGIGFRLINLGKEGVEEI